MLDDALQGYDPSAEIESGHAFCFLINGAAVLLRVEQFELVVVAFQGVHKLAESAGVIVSMAQKIGARSIRVHTQRRGECRYLNRLGYPFTVIETRDDEFVLRMVIHGRTFE